MQKKAIEIVCLFCHHLQTQPIVTEDAAPTSASAMIKVMKVSHFQVASELAGSQSLLNVIAISSGQLPVLKGKGGAAWLTMAHSPSL